MSAASTTGYAALLRTPGALGFSAAAFVGRMPISMVGIGTVLLVQDRRASYALAGLVTATSALGSAVISPQVSRLVDRHGQRRVLPVQLAVSVTGLLALVGLAGTAAPAVTLLLAATVSGGAFPQLGACARARWNAVLTAARRPAEVSQAYAWESVVDEVVFVLGPLLVVACAAIDPAIGLLAAALLATLGTLAFVRQRATEPAARPPGARRPGSALGYRGMRALVVSSACVGAVFGSIEVSTVAYAGEHHQPAAAGWLLALVAAGSGASGLAYGARSWRLPLPRLYVVSALGLGVGCVPLLLAPSVPLLAPAALLAGLAVSPTIITSFALVDLLVPAAARTEGFTWLTSGIGLGIATGSSLAGALADGPGARAGYAVSVAGGLAAAAVAAVAGRAARRVRGTAAVPPG